MIRFNDSWFVFHDSSWSFHKPYFSRKRMFHKSYRVNRTQGYGLKTCKQVPNYSIMSQILINYLHIIHFFIELKFCKHFFTESKITNWNDQTMNHANIFFYCLICSGVRKAFPKSLSFRESVIMCETKYLSKQIVEFCKIFSKVIFDAEKSFSSI